jgi:hypothetical protein
MLIQFYTRRGCHLCEAAWDAVSAVGPALGAECVAIDVDGDHDHRRLYGDRVPVLAIEGVAVLEGRFDEDAILRAVRGPLTNPASSLGDPVRPPGPPPT